ncbi:transposase [Altererythrobacter sp. SALINAS58]|nr:transposase [Alteripontixanthobacter muriae]
MSQVTVFSGPERRRRWREDERLQILAEAFSPGAGVTEVCRRHDMSSGLIYTWRHRQFGPASKHHRRFGARQADEHFSRQDRDSNRQAERCRPADLARRHPRAHCRSPRQQAR